jgi:wyosine [tRNA(Phe)-imidazoG37] synthetase (radical SAM superfamily)
MLSEPPVDADRVLDDLEEVLKRLDLNTVDIVTFSGTGEPTLNLKLGDIAKRVKSRIGSTPLAILTNSSLFCRHDITENLSQFDLIVAKLDAGDNETFQQINRPADKKLNVKTIVDSIRKLRKAVKGTVALETMLLRSENRHVTNIEGKSLRNLLDAILDIKPDQVQLEVPYRPPSENFVQIPPQEKIRMVFDELSKELDEDKIWIYGQCNKGGRGPAWLSHESLEKEIIELLKRRPCRLVDVSASLGIEPSLAKSLLEKLRKKHSIVMRTTQIERYYCYIENLHNPNKQWERRNH